MDPEEQARREAQQAAADERLSKIGEMLGGSATARAVFGDPVERDGITVIPVARVRYGFGGGSGGGGGRRRKRDEGGDEDQFGSGVGGGVDAAPLGYIEIHDGQARFTRIRDLPRMLAMLAGPLAALAFGAVLLVARRGGR
jgi:uncharacterized spore protein YtfJ